MPVPFLGNAEPEDQARAEQWFRRFTIYFCLIAFVLGAAECWTSRFAMNPDGVQYLDNATAYWSGDFRHAINSQWSPLYPWLIGAWFAIFHPGPYLEFPLVHALNFLIYLLSLAAFLFFVRKCGACRHLSTLLIACSSFLYCSLDFTSLSYVTPDLLVSFFTFLAAGLLLGLRTRLHFAGLGAVLGFGYLAKTPFLLFGLLCLAMAAVIGRKRAWLTAAIFAFIALPYICILSSAKGRFTAGDSGRWNIIWMVNRVPLYNWQGGPPDNGYPIHPTRKLSSDPDVFEFASPVGGTYPPWYDPIYWSEGARIAFRPADFARALVEQVKFYGYLVHHGQLPLVFAVATFFLLAADKRRLLGTFWPVLLLGLMPFAVYAFVHAEARYLSPFFVLLWTILTAALLTRVRGRAVLPIAAVAAALMLVEAIAAIPTPAQQHYEVARGVQALGLKKGDWVAIVNDLDYSWARLAGVRVTMQVDFGKEGPAEWEKAKKILSANGVVMVVSPHIPSVVDQPGWRQLGETGVYVYKLAAQERHNDGSVPSLNARLIPAMAGK